VGGAVMGGGFDRDPIFVKKNADRFFRKYR